MKLLLKYNTLIMAIGLIPAIVCMILCIFFPDAKVLYICSLVSIMYILYKLARPSVHLPNLILLHVTLALAITSLIKGISSDMLIPDRTVPITLEILMLCFSLPYLIAPHSYSRLFSKFHYEIPILNFWATQVITVLSVIHLFALCLIYLLFHPLSHNTLYVMTHITPPLVYILCIIVNYAFIKTISQTYKKIPILRIAPICNGKIYVVPRNTQDKEYGKLDLPMEDYIYPNETDTDKYAGKIASQYLGNISYSSEPRFSLKHLMQTDKNNESKKTIILYVLPLTNENQLSNGKGKFVTPEEIEKNSSLYSSLLREEIDHLDMVTQIWKEFK